MKDPDYVEINKIFENINSFKDFENKVSALAKLLKITENTSTTDKVCKKLYKNTNETNTKLDEITKNKINQYLKLNYVISNIIPNPANSQASFGTIKEALGIIGEQSNAEIAKKLLEYYDNLSNKSQDTCRVLVAIEAIILTIKQENIEKFSNKNNIIAYPAKHAKAKIQNKHLIKKKRNLHPDGLEIEFSSLKTIQEAAKVIKDMTEKPKEALNEIYKQLSESDLPAGVAEFKMLHLLNAYHKNNNENLKFMDPYILSEFTQGNLNILKTFTDAALKTKDPKNLGVQIAAKVLVNTGNFSGEGLEILKRAIKGKNYTSIKFQDGKIFLYKKSYGDEPKYIIEDPIVAQANEALSATKYYYTEDNYKKAIEQLKECNSANCKKIEVDPKTKTIKITHADSTTTKLAKNSAKSSNKAQAGNNSNKDLGPQQKQQTSNRLKSANKATKNPHEFNRTSSLKGS